MSFAGLCEMASARGWTIALASQNAGAAMLAYDDVAYLRAVAIYETREAWAALHNPLVTVRLDDPAISLDDAAEAIAVALQAGGVV